MRAYIQEEFERTVQTLERLSTSVAIADELEKIAHACCAALRAGHKIIFAGNGGSAAEAQHLAAELVGRFKFDRPGLAALALTTDASNLTAIGNDYGYECVFARQLDALGVAGDVFFALSTSGTSPNVLRGLEAGTPKRTADGGLDRRGGRSDASAVRLLHPHTLARHAPDPGRPLGSRPYRLRPDRKEPVWC